MTHLVRQPRHLDREERRGVVGQRCPHRHLLHHLRCDGTTRGDSGHLMRGERRGDGARAEEEEREEEERKGAQGAARR